MEDRKLTEPDIRRMMAEARLRHTGMATRQSDTLIQELYDNEGQWIDIIDRYPTRAASENLLKTIMTRAGEDGAGTNQ